MNEEIKAKWQDDLRGGEYQQGKGCLAKLGVVNGHLSPDAPRRYCCLGVLTDQAVKAGIGKWSHSTETPDRMVYVAPDGRIDRAYLPRVVAEWAGIPTGGGYGGVPLPVEDNAFNGDTLAGRNDYGTSFEGIADLIEEHL